MKNTFLQSPVIAVKHIKNSAWAIEKIYSKTCVRKGYLSVIYTTITMVAQAQFLPVFRRNSSGGAKVQVTGHKLQVIGHRSQVTCDL